MLERLFALPLFVILMGIGAAAMLVPAAHAAVVESHEVMRAFFYSGIIFLVLTALIAIATSNYKADSQARSHLLALLATFAVLPAMLAVPVYESVTGARFFDTYVEMVSSLTTTGATLYEPGQLPASVHLWRALVGWMGGFFVWVTAAAILAPLNLGGFEVLSQSEVGQGASGETPITKVADVPLRIVRYAERLFPVYAGLTLVLWVALLIAGNSALLALCLAMSTLATSGIAPVAPNEISATSGFAGEFLVFAFLIFAISRRTFAADRPDRSLRVMVADPEFRMGIACVVAVPTLLFLRHWLGAIEVERTDDVVAGWRALWGGAFTVMSFLTTTGFVSAEWDTAQIWSGLTTPGLLLMGLALVGGGVATTAGGVKLLRVYALYKHGLRELNRLVHPSSIGGSGALARRLRRQGAYVAWIFFMLFALSIALVTSALALTGLDFERATVLTIATLSTTGPLADVASGTPVAFGVLPDAAKTILVAAMVLGRLETLAIIALLNPDFWRR